MRDLEIMLRESFIIAAESCWFDFLEEEEEPSRLAAGVISLRRKDWLTLSEGLKR